MKHRILLIAAVFLLLLTGCSQILRDQGQPVHTPYTFYYAASEEAGFASETGAIVSEMRDLGGKSEDLQWILEQYMEGPENEDAVLPVPGQMELLGSELENGILTIYVSNHWNDQSRLRKHVAEACLVMTMTQFPGVEKICVRTEQEEAIGTTSYTLSPEDFLLFDDSATSNEITVRLYFSDKNGRYLVEETRTRHGDQTGSLPTYIVEELLLGPETRDCLPVLPEGTNLLGVELEDGKCTVNFSEAFLTNRPGSHALARLAVFSVVNSLTELPEIESVLFRCVDKEIGDYSGIDLSKPMFREEIAIYDPKPSAAVLDATLYVPCGGDLLAAVPLQVRQSGGKMGADALLSALMNFKPANGYENPLPNGTALVDQTTQNGVCTVTFNSAFALRNSDMDQLQLAVRSVAASLCSLDQIRRVIVNVAGSGLESDYLNHILIPQSQWFLP